MAFVLPSKGHAYGVLLGLGVCAASCRTAEATDTSARTAPGTYDVIVVGSGAGGGPLAARLAKSGKHVLLIEAGADVGDALSYQVPARHALSTEDPAMAWHYFVSHHADASIDAADSKHTKAGALYPRGSALGGSTAVNAMVTVLPSRSDWNRLAELTGDASFRADAMTKYETRVREWLDVSIPDPSLALGDRKVSSFLGAAARTFADRQGTPVTSSLGSLLGRDVNDVLRSGEAEGVYRLPLATKEGHRTGAREAIVAARAAYGLEVKTGTFVTRVLFDGDVAKGVEVVEQANVYGASLSADVPTDERKSIFGSEIVISAGTFNTPQILKLSGVDRAGVGLNLQDRYEAPVVTHFEKPLDILAPCTLDGDPDTDPCVVDWRAGRGVYTTPGFLASVLMRSSSDLALADLQVFAVPTDARGYYPGYSADSAKAKNAFTFLLLEGHTHNRDGVVSITSDDPFARPKISFNDFDEKNPLSDPDLLAMVKGVKFVRDIEKQMRADDASDTFEEVWPGRAATTDAELATWIRKETWGHHACCTSKMGTAEDDTAVVDARFRVIGKSHLRVVDASVFPEIPGTFIAMPTYMMSEKAADSILEDMR